MRARWAVFVAVAVLVMVCGCGGGGSTPTAIGTEGTVELPAGTALRLADLQVMTCLGSVPVSADGRFLAREPGSGPAQVMLLNRDGDLVMLGYLDANHPQGGKINARETAVALLLCGLLPVMPPRAYWGEVLDLIRQAPQADALRQVIAGRLAANPTALDDGDTAIITALKAALESLRAGTLARRLALMGPAQPSHTSPVEDISPTGIQSGLELLRSGNTNGVHFTNHYRTPWSRQAYRTGYRDAADQYYPLSPWQRMTSPALAGIPAVTSPSGPIGTLTNLCAGQVAWTPTSSPSFDLPIDPPNVREVYYTLFAVGPGEADGGTLEDLLASYSELTTSEKDRIRSSQTWTCAVTCVQEILFPLLLAVLPTDNLMKGLTAEEAEQAAFEVYQTLLTAIPDLGVEMGKRDYHQAVKVVLEGLASSDTAQRALVNQLVRTRVLQLSTGVNLDKVASSIGKSASSMLKVKDALMTLYDLHTVVKDIQRSKPMEAWTATVKTSTVPRTFALQPATSQIAKHSSRNLTVTCTPDFPTGTNLEFAWTCTSSVGTLVSCSGSMPAPFTSTVPNAVYKSGSTLGSDTVTVSILQVAGDGSRMTLGQASASVTVKGGQMVETTVVTWGPFYWTEGNTSYYRAGVQPVLVFEGTRTAYQVIYHCPGYGLNGRTETVYPRISKGSLEAQYGGHNIYELTDNQRALILYRGATFAIESTPPITEVESAARFAETYPHWQEAASDPALVQASTWKLEILN